MKSFAILSLSLLAEAATLGAPVLDKRQFDVFGFGIKQVVSKPNTVNKLKAQYHPDAIHEQLVFGPYTLQPSNGTHIKGGLKLDKTSDVVNARLKGLCEGCMVLSAKSDIARADGTKIDIATDNIYSHHVLMSIMGRPMAPINVVPGLCPNGKMGGFDFGALLGGGMGGGHASMGGAKEAAHGGMSMKERIKRQFSLPPGLDMNMVSKFFKFSVFMGQGEDASGLVYTDPTNKIKSGFYLSAKDEMNMMAELINYDPFAKQVYVTLDYEYIPNMPTQPKDYLTTGMNAINVNPCGSQALYPPNDKAVKYTSPPWNVLSDGYLLDVKPHMHDGGMNITFAVNGKTACVSKAVYGDAEQATTINGQKWQTIESYTPCTEPVKVTKGDKLTMEAWYDLTQHKLRPMSVDTGEAGEGMAIALFVYAVPQPL